MPSGNVLICMKASTQASSEGSGCMNRAAWPRVGESNGKACAAESALGDDRAGCPGESVDRAGAEGLRRRCGAMRWRRSYGAAGWNQVLLSIAFFLMGRNVGLGKHLHGYKAREHPIQCRTSSRAFAGRSITFSSTNFVALTTSTKRISVRHLSAGANRPSAISTPFLTAKRVS